MKNFTVLSSLFLATIVSTQALAETTGEVSCGYANDYIGGVRNGRYVEVFYDGDIFPCTTTLRNGNFEYEFGVVLGVDNFEGKPLVTSGAIDYTFYQFNTQQINWSLSTGVSAATHDASDNYQVSISGIEGTLVNLGFKLKGGLNWLPNTYLQAEAGYTESLSNSSESSLYALAGFGFEMPLISPSIGEVKLYVESDIVYTEVLAEKYVRVKFGLSYAWSKDLTIYGPGRNFIIPTNGKRTSSTDVLIVKWKF